MLHEPAEIAAIRIDPPVEVEARWLSEKTLELRALEDFPLGTEFSLHVSGDWLDRDGYPLAAATSHTFRTPRLALTDVSKTSLSRD